MSIRVRVMAHDLAASDDNSNITYLSNWPSRPHYGHTVQYYRDASRFLDLLSRYVGMDLGRGDSYIIVAMPEHRQGLAERLELRGFNLAVLRTRGTYIERDAAEVLDQLMTRGMMSRLRPGAFNAVMGPMLDRAAETSGHTRVYGEMVALLWAAKNAPAALSLEQAWNTLLAKHQFTLLCAYPLAAFEGRRSAARSMAAVSACHQEVVEAEAAIRA